MNKKLLDNENTIEYEHTFHPDKSYPFWINQCGHTYCGKGYGCTRGVTSFYTIEYIIKGKGYIQENDTICHPQAGDTHIFHSGSIQTYHSDPDDPWEKLWVIFYGPLADSLFEIYGLNDHLFFPQLDTSEQLEKLIEICDDEELPVPERISRASVCVFELVQQLYSYTVNNKHHSSKLSIADQLKVIIDNMCDFTLSLSDITTQLYCSRNHAIRSFTRKFGISPYQYMSEKRLSNAKYMLKSSRISIGEIARSLSFCDSRYFANWFKSRTQMTPREYRNLHQSENITE